MKFSFPCLTSLMSAVVWLVIEKIRMQWLVNENWPTDCSRFDVIVWSELETKKAVPSSHLVEVLVSVLNSLQATTSGNIQQQPETGNNMHLTPFDCASSKLFNTQITNWSVWGHCIADTVKSIEYIVLNKVLLIEFWLVENRRPYNRSKDYINNWKLLRINNQVTGAHCNVLNMQF